MNRREAIRGLDSGSLALLVMDMYEHAYHMNDGANAHGYLEAFFQNINWDEVNRRAEDRCSRKVQEAVADGIVVRTDEMAPPRVSFTEAFRYWSRTSTAPQQVRGSFLFLVRR